MKKPNGYQVAIIASAVAIYGIIASKLIEHDLLQNTFVDILTIVLLTVFGVICAIIGWSLAHRE